MQYWQDMASPVMQHNHTDKIAEAMQSNNPWNKAQSNQFEPQGALQGSLQQQD